ncbi:Cupredoxin [Penicillium cinerascens]|uniref:Cupredoxin n=1 Tax=Penicillium cinerascens TaxID=70096 RepID=A0A9W9N3U2_9EURO|nr:Cupredoxin [Penicillium cinerascens]KAJ5212681.1 Cupredoxin [Penicillium cinerascens]
MTTTTTTAAATKSVSSSGSIQSINVGKAGLTFDPDTLNVAAGDKVEFHFFPGDHSVTQASFDNPCHPLNSSSFFSGFVAPSSGESSAVFTLTVNDTNPIWFYCGQTGHCQAGMVGVINPGSGPDTLDAFKKAAASASGDSVPAMVQGGILGKASAQQSSTSTTGSSTSTKISGSSATNSADSLRYLTDISITSVLALLMAMLLM